MIVLTSLFGAIILFVMVYIIMSQIQQKYGFRSQLLRRLNKLKEHYDVNKTQTAQAKKKFKISLPKMQFLKRITMPMFTSLKKKLLEIAPTDVTNIFESRIVLAGKAGQWRVDVCVAFWFLSIVVCAIITLFLLRNTEFMFFQKILLMMIGGVFGAFLPFIILRSIIQKRQRKIVRQMPEFLDLLCVSVQAGLTFDGALTKIVSRMKGPLIDECKHVQRDGQMGIPRRLSLQQMAKRCDIEEIYLFTSSIIQSEKLGTSMAKTLSNQAENVRERHRQWVKAQALKAPVKIVFPLVLFIFPAIFVVVLLPTVMTMIKNLGQ